LGRVKAQAVSHQPLNAQVGYSRSKIWVALGQVSGRAREAAKSDY